MSRAVEPSEHLLDLIYDAATDQALWSGVLIEIADATRGVGCHIFGADGKPGSDNKERFVTFAFLGRFDEEVFRRFSERHVISPYSAVMDNSPAGKFVLSDEIISLRDVRRTALFDEVLDPLDVGHTAMVSLAAKDDFRVGLVVSRSEREGPHDADGLNFLSTLYSHVRRSIGLSFRIEGYREIQNARFDILDRLSAGVILLDRRANILYANSTARRHGADDGPLRLRSSGVSVKSIAHDRQLFALVRKALRGAAMGAMGVPLFDGRSITLIVSSVRGNDIGRFADAQLPDAAVLIFIVDPANRSAIPREWIMDAYGLTSTEARVALATSGGLNIPEVAIQLGISRNTVKTHLRNVFAKTGAGRQPELARMLAVMGLLKG